MQTNSFMKLNNTPQHANHSRISSQNFTKNNFKESKYKISNFKTIESNIISTAQLEQL